MIRNVYVKVKVLLHDRVTIDGVRIGNWIYWTLTDRNYKYASQSSSSIIWGLYNRPEVAAVPTDLVPPHQ
jgi:hypothetical protein